MDHLVLDRGIGSLGFAEQLLNSNQKVEIKFYPTKPSIDQVNVAIKLFVGAHGECIRIKSIVQREQERQNRGISDEGCAAMIEVERSYEKLE